MSNSRLVSCGNGRVVDPRRTCANSVTPWARRVVEHDVAGGDGADGVLDPLGTGALDEVSAGTIAQCGQRVVEVFRHRQHHHSHLRVVLGEPSVDLETGRVGQAHVEQQHRGRRRLDERGHLVGALRLTDELDAIHLLDRRGQPQAEHRMVVDDGDTKRASAGRSRQRHRKPNVDVGAVWVVPRDLDAAAELGRPLAHRRPPHADAARRPQRRSRRRRRRCRRSGRSRSTTSIGRPAHVERRWSPLR